MRELLGSSVTLIRPVLCDCVYRYVLSVGVVCYLGPLVGSLSFKLLWQTWLNKTGSCVWGRQTLTRLTLCALHGSG